jgi:uncharacterized OB-fold protein
MENGRPVPEPTPLSAPFWRAAADGVLVVQRCQDCGRLEWTPQVACSRCLTETLQWARMSGRGTVYSFSVVHRPQTPAFPAPYVVAIVELEEGVRMLTDLVGVHPEQVRIGQPVAVAFDTTAPVALYHFAPVDTRS